MKIQEDLKYVVGTTRRIYPDGRVVIPADYIKNLDIGDYVDIIQYADMIIIRRSDD